jgi:hypothetical protein
MNLRNFSTSKEIKDALKVSSADQKVQIINALTTLEQARIAKEMDGSEKKEIHFYKLWRNALIFGFPVLVSLLILAGHGIDLINLYRYKLEMERSGIAIKAGMQYIDGHYLKDENARTIIDQRYRMAVFQAGGVLVGGNIINAKKDTVRIHDTVKVKSK